VAAADPRIFNQGTSIMRTQTTRITTAALLLLAATAKAQGAKPLTKCPPDAVVTGTVCIDAWEASVWRIPDATAANAGLVKRLQQGKATALQLVAGGATQLGLGGDD